MPAFPLSHAWVVRDLTPIVTIDRRVGWTYPPALPKWEGGLSVDDFVDFQVKACFKMYWLLPLGGDGRGVLRPRRDQRETLCLVQYLHFAINALAQLLFRHFQIVAHLQTKPNRRACAEITG